MPQNTSNTQLPEWFYRELTSIRRDVSVLDATGASKEQIQELKERIGKVEVRLEESQLRVDGKLNEQSGRIGDISDSNSFSITLFSVIAGVLGTLVALITIINSWRANREAVDKAEKAANEKLAKWTLEKETELTKKFDQKLTELSERHEKEFQKIRDNAEEQALDNDINEAYALAGKDRIGDAMSRINNVVRRVEKSDSIKHQRVHAKALYYKGLISYAVNQKEAVLKVFDELILKFKDSDDAAIQEQVAKALLNKGVTLGQLDRLEDAIVVFDALFDRLKDNDDDAIQERIAKVLFNKSNALGQLNRFEEAIAVYDAFLDQFKDSDDAAIRGLIINVICNKAEFLLATQAKDQAIKAIQNAITFLKDDNKVYRAVMEMLSFIIEKSTLESVLVCIDAIMDEDIDQSFDPIRDVIDTLEPLRKEQVQALARFFEDHHDKAKLKEELDQIPEA